MKRTTGILVGLIAILSLGTLTGCETAEEKEIRLARQHEREMAKIESGYYAQLNEARHEERMAYYSRPVAPGAYIDYRGNMEYGYWDAFGHWAWYDNNSIYAQQSRNYVSYQIATGALVAATAYSLTRDSWSRNHPSGWQSTNITVNNYTSSDGKPIDKKQYDTRVKTASTRYASTRTKLDTTQSKAPQSVKAKVTANQQEVAKNNPTKFQSSSVAQGGWGKKKAAQDDKQWGNCTTNTCKQNRQKAKTELASTNTTQPKQAKKDPVKRTTTTTKVEKKVTKTETKPRPTKVSYAPQPKAKPKPKPTPKPPKKKKKY